MTPLSTNNTHDPERLSLYALDVLPAGEVPALEAHVSTCAQCRKELEALRRVDGDCAPRQHCS